MMGEAGCLDIEAAGHGTSKRLGIDKRRGWRPGYERLWAWIREAVGHDTRGWML